MNNQVVRPRVPPPPKVAMMHVMSEVAQSAVCEKWAVQLQPSGQAISCVPEQSLLEAVLQAGVSVPYQCKTGACQSCQAQVLEGQALRHDGTLAGPGDTVLMCCTQARSALQLQCQVLDGAYPVVKRMARVVKLERLAADVMQLQLALPEGQTLDYAAGQYVDVLLAKGVRRSYSLASPPTQDGLLELHVRYHPGGVFSEQVFQRLKPRDVLRLEGPFGQAVVNVQAQAGVDTPLLLLATGTGMAPIQALIASAQAAPQPRPMVLYWGGRQLLDLYLHAQCQAWQTQYPWFRYVPVLSQPASDWQGRVGYVQDAVLQDGHALPLCEAYACGAPAMVQSARTLLQQHGLPGHAFYADAFTVAPEGAAA